MDPSAKAPSTHREAIEAAPDTRQLGAALTDAAQRLAGASSMCFLPFGGQVSSLAEATLYHERYTAETMAAALLSHFPLTERELGDGRHSATERLFGTKSRAIDLNAMLCPEGLEQTTVFNEFWRPYQIERQVFVPLVAADGPLGYLCLSRTASEREFRANEIEHAAWLGEHATAALQRLRRARPIWSPELLQALRMLPVACALFDATPRLLWLSSAAERMLGLSLVAASYTHVLTPSAGLYAWQAAAQRALTSDNAILQEDELLLQRMSNEHGEVVLVTRSGSSHSGQQRVERMQARWGLTARETHVLQELANGSANKEIARNLGCSFRTVETHISALLRKSGCASRTELLAQLWA